MWGFLLLFLISCQTSNPVSDASLNNIHMSEIKVENLDQEKENILDNLRALSLELEWLKLRKLIVEAQLLFQEALKSELSLKSDYANFESINKHFPSNQGFITENKRIEWQARMEFKTEETKKHRAQVRLLNRDMNALEAKLFRNGYSYDQLNSTLKLSNNQNL